MRLPALWLAVAFAIGITVAGPHALPAWIWIAASAAPVLLGGILLWRRQVLAAWILALAAWFGLGGFALTLEHAAVPPGHVTRLLAAGRLDNSEPLRWRGRLREDPLRLPWGQRYEIDLEQVEIAGATTLVSGGLRANLYAGPRTGRPPDGLRAGDRVEALLRAKPPRNFLDPGAPDIHSMLARQNVDLAGSLRTGELLQLIVHPRPTLPQRFARARGNLLSRLDALYSRDPKRAAILRAMLLGDRSFIDSDVVASFQKTSAYHVLVVAGLHVGAVVVFMLWICRRLRLPSFATTFATLAVLASYVAVVQDRPPIFRAALMAAFYLIARPLFRRIDLLNTISLAGLALIVWKPSLLADPSFQLSFLAAGVITGLALPWIERTSARYRSGLAHLGDVTRDVVHSPRIAQFRIELRAASDWLARRLPQRLASYPARSLTIFIRGSLRLWDIVVMSLTIQLGMMPSLAQQFHRVTLAGPLSNVPAVILTGLIVPLGFLCLALTFVWGRLAALLANALSFCVAALLACVEWFGRLPRFSYRVPGPPGWLFAAFLAALIFLAAVSRQEKRRRSSRDMRRQPLAFARLSEWIGAAAVAVFAVLVATHPFAPNLERGKLEITTLDVGEGDSIFAAFPHVRTMLVDAGGLAGSERIGGYRRGPDVGEEVVSPFLWSRGLKRLDVIVMTHADHDHIDGFHSVLQNFGVGEVWIGAGQEKPAFKTLLAEVRSLAIPMTHKTTGARFE